MTDTQEYRYRITSLEGGTAKYGVCEVCEKPVDKIFYQVEERSYEGVDGQSWTQHNCFSRYGHEKCLLNKRR